jgi:hypothetical protein
MRARAPRPSALLLAAIAAGVVAAVACSLAGLADPPQASASSGSSEASSGSGVYEAEDAGLYGKFVIGDDRDASNGEYVYVPQGAGCSDGLSEVVFDVAVGASGKYVIWARVYSNSSEHDSFFVSADMGPEALFRVPVLASWVEESVFDEASEVKTAIQYAWDAGSHRIVFKCRGDATLLDRIRIDTVPP